MMKPGPIRDYTAEDRLFRDRAITSFVIIIILVAALIANLYGLQVPQFEHYQTRSNDNRVKVIPIAPSRGLIYDRNGVVLAENKVVLSLRVNPEQAGGIDRTILKLKKIMEIPDKEITRFKRRLGQNQYFDSFDLVTQLTREEAAKFSVNKYEYPGVSVAATLRRHYPFGEALTHVIGYVSRINSKELGRLDLERKTETYKASKNIGKLGVERYYEDILHGRPGRHEVEVNSQGQIVRTLRYVPPTPGKDIILSIDFDLQMYVYNLLKGHRGSAIVLDAKDSSILAMVSSPSYDPNEFVRGISEQRYRALLEDKDRPLVNRATLGIYPPASTVKPLISVAALTEGVITASTTRSDPGYWSIPNSSTKPFRDWLRWGHGRVDVIKAIEESVDTFFYQISYEMGIERLSKWMGMFGYGKHTGIDIFEENEANMPTREWKMWRYHRPWYQGDTIPVGIGQGYWTATPIQIAKATSVLVSHGQVLAPHLLRTIVDHRKSFSEQKMAPFEHFPPIQNVPEKYWDIALHGMYLVNNGKRGTARKAFYGAKYTSAGKSGTAQVFGLEEREEYNAFELVERLRDHALYTSLAPVDNPEVITTIVLENAGSGSIHGAPLARLIFDHVLLKDKKPLE